MRGLAFLGRCYGYLKPYSGRVAAAGVCLVFINAAAMAQPQLIRHLVDAGIAGKNQAAVTAAVLLLLGVVLVKGGLSFLQGRSVEIASQGVAYDLRREMHDKLTALSFSFHDRSEAGQLLSRAVQDVDRVRFAAGRASLRLIDGTVGLAATGVMLFTLNFELAVMACCLFPLLIYRAVRLGALVRPLGLCIQDKLGVLTARLEQNLRGARIVRAFAQEEREIESFMAENRSWLELSNRQARVQAVHGPILTLITDLAGAAVVLFGGLAIIAGRLSYGEFLAFLAYLGQLAHPVHLIGMLVPAIGMAAAAGERVFDIIDARPEVEDRAGARSVAAVRGEVRFDKVGFEYDRRAPALRELSFTVRPGEAVALVGSTGSGKTTVANLIPRFYDVSSGAISIDGVDIRQFTLESLRRSIGVVLQESVLFATTIRENIRFGSPEAGEGAIIEAAKAAQIHDFIMASPLGYDTPVGERGLTLSGGQKQRVAIARALLKKPRILILDDATSSVDPETERRFQLVLAELMRGRTTFIIAQRLSTLRLADRILVLEHGRLAAQGSHAELLASSRHYAELCRRQTGREVSSC